MPYNRYKYLLVISLWFCIAERSYAQYTTNIVDTTNATTLVQKQFWLPADGNVKTVQVSQLIPVQKGDSF